MNAKQVLVSYLWGLRDSGVDLGHDEYEFPLALRPAVVQLMNESSEPSEADADVFAPWGKWHRAANVAMHALDKESRNMTALYERSEGVNYGDRLHAALMNSMRASI